MICKVCNIDKIGDDFRVGRKTCKRCENLQRYERTKEYKKNPEYMEKFREYDAMRKRDRRKNDEEFIVREKLRCVLRRGIKKYGYIKDNKTLEILGADYEYVREYISSMFVEGMSWDNHGEWEIDHIIPVSSAKTYDEFCKLNHYSNLQPLWMSDNRSKGSKIL